MKLIKNKILHLGTTFKTSEKEDGSIKITGYASTNDVDRVGDVILAEAWSKGGLDNFKKNPIILFNHNYDKPIGKATSVSVSDKGLGLEATISKAAGEIVDLIKDGILGAFSVGFRIKDASYDSTTDIYFIKDAELYEVSVVSIPCNQDATFSLAKSFDSEKEYKEYVKQFIPAEHSSEDSVNAQDSAGKEAKEPIKKENIMDPEQIKEMLEQIARETAKSLVAEQAAAATKEREEATAAAAEAEKLQVAITSGAEKLMADIEKRFSEKNESLEAIVTELKDDLKEKSTEIERMRDSKRTFSDRGTAGDWKKEFEGEIVDNYILGLATGKGWTSKRSKSLLEKVNAHSGVEVSSEDFEQVVSTNIERDIELELILAPLFRELPMTAATMILPIMPDAGYAQFGAPTPYADRNAGQTPPKGNLDEKSADYGDHAGMALQERTVTTKKLMSTSYLGNETEEDAILPILPLIREGMVRSHARAIENALLLGNHAQGAFGTGGSSFEGLITLAVGDNQTTQPAVSGFAASDVVTAADLFTLRKSMGKYGLRPEDVVYIVSQDAYFNLIEDAEFQDVNLVGSVATKLRGSIGQVYGSNVIVCPEFAGKAAGAFNAVAVNTRNFAIPRLRGMRVETDYEVKEQRRVLVASQRLGFIDIIDGAAAKWALQYKGT